MHPILVLGIATGLVFLLIIRFKVNAFISLITAALAVGVLSPRIRLGEAAGDTADIFGHVAGQVAVVIALSAVIAQCLMESGAADKISRRLVSLFGERFVALALLVSGFALAIPVFFDTVFYLLVPLVRAMAVRTGRNYLLLVMSVAAGATISHSLVPPTPGPLAVATALHIDLGTAILAGIVFGLPASIVGWLYSRLVDRRMNVGFRNAPGLSLEELRELSLRPEKHLPGFTLAVLPIALPVLLITANTAAIAMNVRGPLGEWTAFLGNPNFALLVAAAVALYGLARQKRSTLAELARPVNAGLRGGGIIVLITCAGGAFGGMLAKAGVGDAINDFAARMGVSVLLVGFLLAALFRVAQGSSTAAMITAAAILNPMIQAGVLPFHPVYLAVAIGAGSKVGSWMNDSGFWVIQQMSGLTETEMLKTWTPMTALMGTVAFTLALLASHILPLVPK